MLIPSIDLMGGKIVQLVQGSKKALEFDECQPWIERFADFPIVQLVDLDAAMGNGSNRDLIRELCAKLPCQVGGGIRSAGNAQTVIECGAKRVILGSSLVRLTAFAAGDPTPAKIDTRFAQELCRQVERERLIFAVDTRGEYVAINGWKTGTNLKPEVMMQQLEPFCSAFLYTNIDTEGLMQGIPLDTIRRLRRQTTRRLIAAGGIRCQVEIETLDKMGVDAVVGMAIYSGLLEISPPAKRPA